MSNLKALNVKARTSVNAEQKLINQVYGFDPNDIVVPIRGLPGGGRPGEEKCYFTARTRKDMEKTSRQVARIDYVVVHTLSEIAAMSRLFFKARVIKRREDDAINEDMVFVASRVHENLVPVYNPLDDTALLGTRFFYEEDGDVEPVEYLVEETIPVIVAQT